MNIVKKLNNVVGAEWDLFPWIFIQVRSMQTIEIELAIKCKAEE